VARPIKVKVADGRGGEAIMQLTIEVRANHPPVIGSLTAERTAIVEAGSTSIECVASDPDGDELTYEWTATGGEISGQGSTITWEAPNSCADYVVTITVTDGRGGEASEELGIEVRKSG